MMTWPIKAFTLQIFHRLKNFKFQTLNLKSQKGFSLVEIIVVITIMGIIAATVLPRILGRTDQARQLRAKNDINQLVTAVKLFKLDTGRYPTTEEGLKALREKPSDADNWRGPYLEKELGKDPWGQDYIYRYPGEHGDFDILSYGADKQPGGEGYNQDIVSWKD
jgi:general secretion pathway protein G